jgi:hypothetical protein
MRLLIITILLFFYGISSFFSQSDELLKYGIPYRKENKWGYMNHQTKKMMIYPIYDSISHFPIGNHTSFFKENKEGVLFYGIVNNESVIGELIPAKYNYIYRYDKWFFANKNGRNYCYDLKGDLVLLLNHHYFSFIPQLKNEESRLLVTKGVTNFSFGIFDTKNKTYITDTIYSIEKMTPVTTKEHSESLNKRIYNVVLKNIKNHLFVLDHSFNLIKIEDMHIEPQIEGVFTHLRLNPNIYKQKFYIDFIDSTILKISTKKYKSSSKIKYYLTNKVENGYRVIVSKNRKYGLISESNPDYKNPDLKPIYENISYISFGFLNVFITETGTEKKGIFISNSFEIKPKYDEILQARDFIELNNDGKKDFIFFDKENPLFLDLNAKKIIRSGTTGHPNIYEVTISPSLYYYIDEEGYKYYE